MKGFSRPKSKAENARIFLTPAVFVPVCGEWSGATMLMGKIDGFRFTSTVGFEGYGHLPREDVGDGGVTISFSVPEEPYIVFDYATLQAPERATLLLSSGGFRAFRRRRV